VTQHPTNEPGAQVSEGKPAERNGRYDSPRKALSDFSTHVAEVGDYTLHYLEARADAVRSKARHLVLMATLGILGLALSLVFFGKVVALLVNGLAGGMTVLVGQRPWLGNLLTATLILAATAIAGFVVLERVRAKWLRQTAHKYEQKRSRRRSRFGRDLQRP